MAAFIHNKFVMPINMLFARGCSRLLLQSPSRLRGRHLIICGRLYSQHVRHVRTNELAYSVLNTYDSGRAGGHFGDMGGVDLSTCTETDQYENLPPEQQLRVDLLRAKRSRKCPGTSCATDWCRR